MILRPATPDDADAVAALEQRCSASPWSPDAVRETLAHPNTLAWVVEGDGGIIGYLLASALGEILTVAVAPEARRRGLGARLVRAATERWAADGVPEAFLEVRADNAPARALYARLGWRAVAERPAYYRDGTDAVVMSWRPGD